MSVFRFLAMRCVCTTRTPATAKSIVHLGQIGRHNDVVRIYYQYHVVSIPIQIFKGSFSRIWYWCFSQNQLEAILWEVRTNCICRRLHMV